MGKIREFFRGLYEKLAGINDTPHKIAAGLALGVFLGILPGVGPLAALGAAFLFKVNRAAALLGSLLTNTWLSIFTFAVSIKIGAFILGQSWQDIQQKYELLIKDFHWRDLLGKEVGAIISPVILGYLVVAFCFAAVSYCLCLLALWGKRSRGKSKNPIQF